MKVLMTVLVLLAPVGIWMVSRLNPIVIHQKEASYRECIAKWEAGRVAACGQKEEDCDNVDCGECHRNLDQMEKSCEPRRPEGEPQPSWLWLKRLGPPPHTAKSIDPAERLPHDPHPSLEP